jgi:hypothetical protein
MSARKYIAVISAAAIISIMVLYALFKLPSPMESIPVDAGWLGFLFIFANGFFLSYLLDKSKLRILERFLLTVGLGFGLTFVVMTLIGVFWDFALLTLLLTQVALLVVLVAIAVFQGFKIKLDTIHLPKKNSFRLNKLNPVHVFLLSIIAVLFFVALYDTVSLPATEWDSLTYGVNYAKIMFQAHSIPLIAGPSIGIEMSAAYPPGIQLTAVFLYLFARNANDFYYRLLQPIFSMATLIVTYKFAMLLNKNRTLAIFAVSVLSLVPYFWELTIEESYLMALTFLLTLAAFFFCKAYMSNSSDAKKYELIGALFCSFAALTSYIGLFGFGILLLYAVIKKSSVKRVALLTALVLVVLLAWYARNLALLGNPVFPFFGIGKYLDPLLKSSTAQHFLHYTQIPLFALTGTLAKIGVVASLVGIGYFTFSKRKNLVVVLPLYFLLICAAVMTFHVPFARYIIVAVPVLTVFFSFIINSIPKRRRLTLAILAVLISVIVLSSALMLPYVNTVKPPSHAGEDKWQYISRIYEEGDAWQWINQNTPVNAKIATFDIKQYYMNRTVFSLDGNESVPLYHMSTIQDALQFLQDNGVGYILSVPWASPTDNRLPPAYNWCPLTTYLGDPDYLPPLFVGQNGTTVYHVGALDNGTVNQAFAQKDMVPPLKNFIVNVTITNINSSFLGEFYLPIPVDYRSENVTASVISSKPLQVQLFNERLPLDKVENPLNFMIASSPLDTNSGLANYTLNWKIDKAGYFTIRVVDNETIWQGAFNVTLNLAFHDYSKKASG